ncbi:MAG TPA: helix-turn-helix domain-containing protein [Herpetosiphonaceae bacterium]|nr:helix-turn-helix domain-containing protein [Herpetosiphonaceae bacterium]
MTRRVWFALFPGCEILDVAGPVQALSEAGAYGAGFAVQYCGLEPAVRTAQGLEISGVQPLPEVAADDWVFVPGFQMAGGGPPAGLGGWLRGAVAAGARVCAVCTGAFVLGAAGLLDGRRCTTHWKGINRLRELYPRAIVLDNRLYVADGPVVTSAGIAAGIDMTIGLLEQDAGPQVAASVAREMVVYMRRDGDQPQASVYLEYQGHLNAGVHQVQQYLINNPLAEAGIDDLAAIAHLSPRHLTRVFRQACGISIGEYRLRLRLERARTLLAHSDLKLEAIAAECGFADARQLRRLWSKHFGAPPSAGRPRPGEA